jgi:hypothetical protein
MPENFSNVDWVARGFGGVLRATVHAVITVLIRGYSRYCRFESISETIIQKYGRANSSARILRID